MNTTLIGRRIRLDYCGDKRTWVKPGMIGTVVFVNATGTIFVKWDDGHSIGLIPGCDGYTVLGWAEEEAAA